MCEGGGNPGHSAHEVCTLPMAAIIPRYQAKMRLFFTYLYILGKCQRKTWPNRSGSHSSEESLGK